MQTNGDATHSIPSERNPAQEKQPAETALPDEKVDENAFACLIVFNFCLDILASPAFQR
jgi:hypothetical protein